MAVTQYPGPQDYDNPYGYRNKIRNGDFSIWQRGIGPFTSSAGGYGGYTADGWIFDYQGTTTNGFMARGQVTPGGEGRFATVILATGMSTTTDNCSITQLIEGVHTLQGKKVTLSFEASVDTATALVAVEVRQNFGTGGSPSAETGMTLTPQTVTTTLTKKTFTFVMPSITGKTRGTNNDDYVSIRLWLSAGSIFNANAGSIGIQNKTWSIARVQLEDGQFATPFEDLPYALQLLWNQRYYLRHVSATANTAFFLGYSLGSSSGYFNIPLTTTMRITPALSVSAVTDWKMVVPGSVYNTLNGMTNAFISPTTCAITCTIAATTLVNQTALYMIHQVSGAWIALSAELQYI